MSDFGTGHDRSTAPGVQARDDATAYLTRTGNADLLPVLGLIDDPVATRRRIEKAHAEVGIKPRSPKPEPPPPVARGGCPLCGNKVPKSGVCRKRLVCREAAIRTEVEAARREAAS